MQKSNCLSQNFLTNNFSNEMRTIFLLLSAASESVHEFQFTVNVCATVCHTATSKLTAIDLGLFFFTSIRSVKRRLRFTDTAGHRAEQRCIEAASHQATKLWHGSLHFRGGGCGHRSLVALTAERFKCSIAFNKFRIHFVSCT